MTSPVTRLQGSLAFASWTSIVSHTSLQEGRRTSVRSAVGAVWRLATEDTQPQVETRLAMAHASGLLRCALASPQGQQNQGPHREPNRRVAERDCSHSAP